MKAKQQLVESVPSNDTIRSWVQNLIFLLCREHNKVIYATTAKIDQRFAELREQLLKISKETSVRRLQQRAQGGTVF